MALFSKEVAERREKLEKFMPIALQARAKVLDILQLDANEVIKDIQKSIMQSPASELLKDYADMILSVHTDAVTIHENDCVGVGGIDFGRIWQYKDLALHQNLVLQALSLFESLKNPPYQIPEEYFIGASPELRDRFEEQDKGELADWAEKKERFEAILRELESMNISGNGTVTPGYLQEVK